MAREERERDRKDGIKITGRLLYGWCVSGVDPKSNEDIVTYFCGDDPIFQNMIDSFKEGHTGDVIVVEDEDQEKEVRSNPKYNITFPIV